MKDQYFGDVNDYRKYGLLRALAGNAGLGTAICWMLTEPDGRSDGKFTEYLDDPDRWRYYDPALYDFLRGGVTNERREVSTIEETEILPRTSFFSSILPDSKEGRADYFSSFAKTRKGSDLVFFDPDNGFNVKSIPLGRKNSSKYVYWDELTECYESGHSVLVYQHFRREERTSFVRGIAETAQSLTGVPWIGAFRTANVVFFLIPRPEHSKRLARASLQIPEDWEGQLSFESIR